MAGILDLLLKGAAGYGQGRQQLFADRKTEWDNEEAKARYDAALARETEATKRDQDERDRRYNLELQKQLGDEKYRKDNMAIDGLTGYEGFMRSTAPKNWGKATEKWNKLYDTTFTAPDVNDTTYLNPANLQDRANITTGYGLGEFSPGDLPLLQQRHNIGHGDQWRIPMRNKNFGFNPKVLDLLTDAIKRGDPSFNGHPRTDFLGPNGQIAQVPDLPVSPEVQSQFNHDTARYQAVKPHARAGAYVPPGGKAPMDPFNSLYAIERLPGYDGMGQNPALGFGRLWDSPLLGGAAPEQHQKPAPRRMTRVSASGLRRPAQVPYAPPLPGRLRKG
ncbi:MAG: hypothetical protein JWQ02_1634 [Capsulimonas sp.]|nr:hypothetical protein [Capsulimonas sp.]